MNNQVFTKQTILDLITAHLHDCMQPGGFNALNQLHKDITELMIDPIEDMTIIAHLQLERVSKEDAWNEGYLAAITLVAEGTNWSTPNPYTKEASDQKNDKPAHVIWLEGAQAAIKKGEKAQNPYVSTPSTALPSDDWWRKDLDNNIIFHEEGADWCFQHPDVNGGEPGGHFTTPEYAAKEMMIQYAIDWSLGC